MAPEAFINLDTEELQVVLVNYEDGIQVTMYSILTGDRVSSGQLIPPKSKRGTVDKMIEDFVETTTHLIESYFDAGEKPEERITEYEEMVRSMRRRVKRTRKRR